MWHPARVRSCTSDRNKISFFHPSSNISPFANKQAWPDLCPYNDVLLPGKYESFGTPKPDGT